MKNNKVDVYSDALFLFSQQYDKEWNTQKELEQISSELQDKPHLSSNLHLPHIHPQLRLKIARQSLLKWNQCLESSRIFLLALIYECQIHSLQSILDKVSSAKIRLYDIKETIVTCAQAPSQTFQGQITALVAKKIDTKTTISIKKDSKILGGIKLQVGNTVIDHSIRTYLNKILNSIL
ncbi:ATP synthase F1 subunit delta [Candidatus Sneabacter namystus]|uniref:ATP synthase F1 subunit delta n=1 Tax=Candidatus Sneabacter namystus TaxID=2601646 RepID=A0A5C0UID9_9RICK|nr:ATP synthase F1 subunit delta [Candidatus Sneabacter namystus]QEK39510.1 ATP synthase F1 subunit delta [Candidatus Sneabacter namystus]